jgi:hypothetical protein
MASEIKGSTRQPVIAERQLVRQGTEHPLRIRIHQPELGGVSPILKIMDTFLAHAKKKNWNLNDDVNQ